LPAGAGKPPNYNGYADRPTISQDVPANTPLNFTFTLDPASQSFLTNQGAQVRYVYHVQVWDVEEFTIAWFNHHDLLSDQLIISPSNTLSLGSDYGNDREIDVSAWAVTAPTGSQWPAIGDGGSVGPGSVPLTQVYVNVAKTPLTPTWWQAVVDTLANLKALVQGFLDRATRIIGALTSDPGGLLDNLVTGFRGAVTQLFNDFGTSSTGLPTALQNGFLAWLKGKVGNVNGVGSIQLSDPNGVTSFLLQWAGLTWDHVKQVLQQELGADNLAAAGRIAGLLDGYDQTSRSDLVRFLQELPGKVADLASSLGADGSWASNTLGTDITWSNLPNQVLNKALERLPSVAAQAGASLAAKFVPGAGVLYSLYQGLRWVLDNMSQISQLFNELLGSLDVLLAGGANAAQQFQNSLVNAFENRVLPLLLDLAASQLGLSGLPDTIQRAVQFIPNKVDDALRRLVRAVAGRLGGGTQGGLFDGKLAPERLIPYNGTTYVLWVARDSAGVKVKVAERTGPSAYRFIGELTAQSFDDTGFSGSARPSVHLQALRTAAASLAQAVRNNVPLAQLRPLQDAVTAAQDVVAADIVANACRVLNAGCFPAGEQFWTPEGFRDIAAVREGDLVFARDESDPDGLIVAKVVEKKFERTGRIHHVHLTDGRLIRTTPEHPFFVYDKGWTAAGALEVGDRIRTDCGWVKVEDLLDTGEYETVYNLRVADYHTYFVGQAHWPFAVWAHNSYQAGLAELARAPEITSRGVTLTQLQQRTYATNVKGFLRRVGDIHRVYRNRLSDFRTELRDKLALDGILTVSDQISMETATRVWNATVNANPPDIDLTLANPYNPTTQAASYQAFQRDVLGNQLYRSFYRRMQALQQAGVRGVEKLVDQLPGGNRYNQHPERLTGMHYQLLRSEAYARAGRLAEVEYPVGTGEVDLRLTDGTLVDAKGWSEQNWQDLPQAERNSRTNDLRQQILTYLGSNNFQLRLEFRYFIPEEVAAMISDLRGQDPLCPDFSFATLTTF
jgi:hypothetical protein